MAGARPAVVRTAAATRRTAPTSSSPCSSRPIAEVDPGLMLDNFLDVAHFPFVHMATFGSAESAEVEGYQLHRAKHGFVR